MVGSQGQVELDFFPHTYRAFKLTKDGPAYQEELLYKATLVQEAAMMSNMKQNSHKAPVYHLCDRLDSFSIEQDDLEYVQYLNLGVDKASLPSRKS